MALQLWRHACANERRTPGLEPVLVFGTRMTNGLVMQQHCFACTEWELRIRQTDPGSLSGCNQRHPSDDHGGPGKTLPKVTFFQKDSAHDDSYQNTDFSRRRHKYDRREFQRVQNEDVRRRVEHRYAEHSDAMFFANAP